MKKFLLLMLLIISLILTSCTNIDSEDKPEGETDGDNTEYQSGG